MADLDAIKRQHSILDVLERLGHTPPTGSNGAADFFIRCPAPNHDDAIPSCRIHPSSNRFHCFGCGAHGDIFDLARLALTLRRFSEALAWVTQTGVTPRRAPASVGRTPSRFNTSSQRVLEINDVAWTFLTADDRAQRARRYLTGRGLQITSVERSAGRPLAGHTPPTPAGLTRHLLGSGFTRQEVIEAGWSQSTESGLRDRFRRRVVFPIRDSDNRVVGITGRDISTRSTAKYLNSPTTPAYRKGEHLYAPIWPNNRTGRIVVCEGPIDALAVAARDTALVAVSPCGTSLTTAQAKLIASFGARVLLLADGDSAGRLANANWALCLEREGATVRIVAIAADSDPASHPLPNIAI